MNILRDVSDKNHIVIMRYNNAPGFWLEVGQGSQVLLDYSNLNSEARAQLVRNLKELIKDLK